MARKSQASETPPEDVPTEGVEETPSTGGRTFVVKHMGITGPITPFLQDQVVTEEELMYNEGVDIDRLLSLGAIVESDGSEPPLEMTHPENQAFVTSTGHVVDQPGLDRPTVASMVRDRSLKVTTAAERLKMAGRGKKTGEDPNLRDPEAIAEQQRVQRNLRDNTVVPAEVAEQLVETDKTSDAEARDAALAENEGVYEDPDPDALAPLDPANAPDMVPEPRGGRARRR